MNKTVIEKSIYMIHYSAETKIVYISMATSWWDIHKISVLYSSVDFYLGTLIRSLLKYGFFKKLLHCE